MVKPPKPPLRDQKHCSSLHPRPYKSMCLTVQLCSKDVLVSRGKAFNDSSLSIMQRMAATSPDVSHYGEMTDKSCADTFDNSQERKPCNPGHNACRTLVGNVQSDDESVCNNHYTWTYPDVCAQSRLAFKLNSPSTFFLSPLSVESCYMSFCRKRLGMHLPKFRWRVMGLSGLGLKV